MDSLIPEVAEQDCDEPLVSELVELPDDELGGIAGGQSTVALID